MAKYELENEQISIQVSSAGAELKSLQDKKTGQEYMWKGDLKYWGRTSPILFPLVGNFRNKEYRFEGRTYPMSQHGFARDMDFTLMEKTEAALWFAVESNQKTMKIYPFAFRLEIGYLLEGRSVFVKWRVLNTDERTMYFSIGGHPGFLCPLHKNEKQTDYSIRFDEKDHVVSRVIGESGLVTKEEISYPLEKGCMKITDSLFDRDALIIENHQVSKVSLLDTEQNPYLSVSFEVPLFGVWSPPKKNAPFVCIEPWCGRCDAEDFTGELSDREWGNVLEAGKSFESGYQIEIS